jgi:hypothetical protein
MKLFEYIWGARPATDAPPRALSTLSSYGLPGYARLGVEGDQLARAWTFDGNELADGGLPALIGRMSAYLGSQGVRLASVEHAPSAEGCRVAINGTRYLVCAHHRYIDSRTAVVSAVQIVNDLLAAAGSKEQGYVLWTEDHGGLALFLTAPVVARLRSDIWLRPSQRPIDVGTYANPVHDALS